MAKNIELTEQGAKSSPQGGVLVGKRNGQTIIYDDGKVGGWFVGKTHKEGGIKGVDKTSGQPIEVQTGEVIITAPALADQSKREFQGKMMTNRDILSKINSDAGGVAFAENGAEVSSKMLCKGGTYSYGGKMMSDKEIAEEINKCGCEHEDEDDKYERGGQIPKSIKNKIYDSNGERKIDNKSIEILNKYVNSLPQTKELNFNDKTNKYTNKREKLHTKIINTFKDQLICIEKKEPIAILMGGSPASGKSTFLRKYAPYLLKEEILKVDADEIRAMLPEYKGYNASQTQAETKDIVNTLLSDRTIGIPCKYDIIYDGTMNSTKSYIPLIDLLKKLNYKIFIVYIDKVPEEVVKKRALERYQKSGRFVPMSVIDDFFGKGKTALNELKSKADGYMVIDGSDSNYTILEKHGMVLPKSRLYSKLGRPIQELENEKFEGGGNLSEGMSLSDIAKMHNVSLEELDKQVELGMKDESIHAGTHLDHFNIVKDHLVESATFYTDESKKFDDGGLATNGDCYVVSGKMAMELENKKIPYVGTPYLVHAEVQHSQRKDIHYGHAFIEDDENVYDFSNKREIILPKQLYYHFGKINTKDPKKYQKYTFEQAREKMSDTGHYGCWDLDVKYGNGGQVKKEDLVKDTKSGNTPARDLNNYNDVMDLEADGMVGMETGLAYAKGGNIKPYDANLEGDSFNVTKSFDLGGNPGLPKVEKIIIYNTSYDLIDLKDKEYTSYIDFLRDVREIFINKKEPCWIYFRINNIPGVIKIKFKDARNTNTYFNPITGKPTDLYKQIDKENHYLAINYDWSDFFSGNRTIVVNPSTSVNVTSSFAKAFDFTNTKLKVLMDKDLSIRVQQKAFDEGWEWEINGKDLNYDSFNYLYFTKKSISHGNRTSTFDSSPKREITEAEIFGNAPQATTTNTSNNILTDLSQTRIWIGNDPKLSKAVQERAFELGWKYPSANEATKSVDKATSLYFYKDKIINYGELRTTFDEKTNLKEIFIEDIFGTNTPNLSQTSSKPVVSTKAFNLDNTKIWVQNNPDLSRRIQNLAFAQGFTNENGSKDYVSADGLTFTTSSSGKRIYGFNSISFFENESEKEIFEEDVFGITKGEKDLFDTIDFIVKNNNLNLDDIRGWADESTSIVNRTKDFDVVNTETGDIYNLRSFKNNRNNLGFADDGINKEQAQKMLEKYKRYKENQSNINVTQPIIKTQPTKSGSIVDSLANTKIWINENNNLSKKVQELAFALGWTNKYGLQLPYKSPMDWIEFNPNKYFYNRTSRDTFDSDPFVEITEVDMMILVDEMNKNQSSTSTTSTFIPDSVLNFSGLISDLPEPIKELALLRKKERKFSRDSDNIKLAFTWSGTKEGVDFWQEITSGNFEPYKKMYGSSSQSMPISSNLITDLSDTKIWVGDNPDLCQRVQERAFELGWKWDDSNPTQAKQLTGNNIYFFANKEILVIKSSKKDFDDASGTEIFESDLFGTNSQQAQSNSNSFNLVDVTDFSGKISDLPEPIKTLAKLRQKEKPLDSNADALNLAFDWEETIERRVFWQKIFVGKFTAYNEKYPSSQSVTSSSNTSQTVSGKIITDLAMTAIKVNRNKALANKIIEKAETLGWNNNIAIKLENGYGIETIWFSRDKYVGWGNEDFLQDNPSYREITEADLFGTSSQQPIPEKKTNKVVNENIADVNKLVYEDDSYYSDSNVTKDRKDLETFKKLLPSFQESKFAVEKATILKEINRLNKKITYDAFLKPNEKNSIKFETFTPQGLLKYYWTQSTQSPVAPLEPACELPTPNGGKSKLPMTAYFNVRTPQFKKWFGDWEKAFETNNYLDCSKMIDEETKEPKIFYHGVRKYVPNFGQFSNMGQGVVRPYGSFEPPTAFPASFFANNIDYAKFYAGEATNMPTPSTDYNGFIYKIFLCIKNPIDLLPLGLEVNYKDVLDYIMIVYGIKIQPSANVLSLIRNDMKSKNPIWVYIRNDVSLLETIKDFGYDALLQMGDIPVFDTNGEVINDRSKFKQDIEYLTLSPTQVKSATVKKSFYFNFFNDIRFNKGGYVCI